MKVLGVVVWVRFWEVRREGMVVWAASLSLSDAWLGVSL